MANTVIQLKHSTIQGNVPVSLANGEISINTRDGKIFYADPTGTIQEFTEFSGPAGLNGEIQFNDSGILGANAGLTFNKSLSALNVASVSITNTYIQFGDGTKQYTANAGTSAGGNSFGRIYTSNNTTFANATVSTDQVTFTGVDGVSVTANATTKVITFAGTPGAQGLTVDYGLVTESIAYSLDYGTL